MRDYTTLDDREAALRVYHVCASILQQVFGVEPVPDPMTESWQQQRFSQGIVHAFLAAPTPLMLHPDDMQWRDAETLALLASLNKEGILVNGNMGSTEEQAFCPLDDEGVNLMRAAV